MTLDELARLEAVKPPGRVRYGAIREATRDALHKVALSLFYAARECRQDSASAKYTHEIDEAKRQAEVYDRAGYAVANKALLHPKR